MKPSLINHDLGGLDDRLDLVPWLPAKRFSGRACEWELAGAVCGIDCDLRLGGRGTKISHYS